MFTKVERTTVGSWLPELLAQVEVKTFDDGKWSTATGREHEKEALMTVLDDLLTEIRHRGFKTFDGGCMEVGDMYIAEDYESQDRDD